VGEDTSIITDGFKSNCQKNLEILLKW